MCEPNRNRDLVGYILGGALSMLALLVAVVSILLNLREDASVSLAHDLEWLTLGTIGIMALAAITAGTAVAYLQHHHIPISVVIALLSTLLFAVPGGLLILVLMRYNYV